MIQHVEESNGVWIQLDEGTVEGECVISLTGHRQQMRDGLRSDSGPSRAAHVRY